jgi:hypothetical protein
LLRAVGAAAVVIEGVAVVAHLTSIKEAVAALELSCAFALFGAIPVDFDLANTIAAITGYGVAVVTLFSTVLVVDSVAAARSHLRCCTARSIRTTSCPPCTGKGIKLYGNSAACTMAAIPARARCASVSPGLDLCIRAGNCRKNKNCGQAKRGDLATEKNNGHGVCIAIYCHLDMPHGSGKAFGPMSNCVIPT